MLWAIRDQKERERKRGIPLGLKSASASGMSLGLSVPVCHYQHPTLGQDFTLSLVILQLRCETMQKLRLDGQHHSW